MFLNSIPLRVVGKAGVHFDGNQVVNVRVDVIGSVSEQARAVGVTSGECTITVIRRVWPIDSTMPHAFPSNSRDMENLRAIHIWPVVR